MGKVVRAVAFVAIGVIISIYAPQLAPAFLKAAIGTVAATAVTAMAMTLAAGMFMQALTTAPRHSGERKPARTLHGFNWVDLPLSEADRANLAPITPHWLRDRLFWPWQRRALIRVTGDCMEGIIATPCWALVDRSATIAPGDLMMFDVRDMWTAYWTEGPKVERLIKRLLSIGMVKRYQGVDPERDTIVYDCTNPPTLCESGRGQMIYACRVASTHPTLWQAWWARHIASVTPGPARL